MTGSGLRGTGTYQAFGDVQSLETPSLELLLRAGDGPERLWAAWALALRHGDGVIPTLNAAAGASSDPGVRAALTVVLAGHGQRDVLAVLATDDPDADVRAAALRHLAGTSLPEHLWVRALLEDRVVVDRSTVVQVVLLDIAISGEISILEPTLADALACPDLRIRERAVVYAGRAWKTDAEPPAGLVDRLGDDELAIRAAVASLVMARSGPSNLAAILAHDWPRHVVDWHLRRLVVAGVSLPWADIQPFADTGLVEDEVLLDLLIPDDEEARPWLLRLVDRGWWPVAKPAWERVSPLLESGPRLSATEIELATRSRDRLTEALVIDEAEIDDYLDLQDLEDSLAPIRLQRDALDRAIQAAGRTEEPGLS